MRKLIPVILALVGIGGGVGAGVLLKPATLPTAVAEGEAPEDTAAPHDAAHGDTASQDGSATVEYVEMTNQFVVPVMGMKRLSALVMLRLSLEVPAGDRDLVLRAEPKLRDSFLQVLFDHANVGGFDGEFTDSVKLIPLRRNLLSAAQVSLGKSARDVLITEIIRQDS